MAHDVFISYSSHDKTAADAVCAVMEHRGIRCWMAPRDIMPGQDWATSIIQAINGSKVFLLIFSAASNESSQVKREVERAANRNLPIIPFRITNMAPNETLEFFISTPHWLDAFTPPLHRHAEKLADTVERLIGPPKGWPDPEPAPGAAEPPPAAASVSDRPKPSPKAEAEAEAELKPIPPMPVEFSDHAPFFLLASAAIGACAYSASLPYFGFWMNTPIYGAVVAFALWRWRKIGLIQAVIWVAVMTGAHFLAYTAAVDLYGKIIKNGPLNGGLSFLVGGVIGSILSLLSLALLGRALANRANLGAVLVWTVVLGLAGGLSGLVDVSLKHIQLTLYVPWQIIFGFAILAVAQGKILPDLGDQGAGRGFWPSSSARGAVIFGVLAAAAVLTVTLVKPDLFKKQTDSTPAAADAIAPAPPAQDAAVTPTPAPTANPEPVKPPPTAPLDDWMGGKPVITPPSTPTTGGESFSPR